MKTKKAYLVIVILLLGSLVGNRVCAQYAPGEVLPDLKTQPENFYDFRHGQKGFVRWVGVGRDTPMAWKNDILLIMTIMKLGV